MFDKTPHSFFSFQWLKLPGQVQKEKLKHFREQRESSAHELPVTDIMHHVNSTGHFGHGPYPNKHLPHWSDEATYTADQYQMRPTECILSRLADTEGLCEIQLKEIEQKWRDSLKDPVILSREIAVQARLNQNCERCQTNAAESNFVLANWIEFEEHSFEHLLDLQRQWQEFRKLQNAGEEIEEELEVAQATDGNQSWTY